MLRNSLVTGLLALLASAAAAQAASPIDGRWAFDRSACSPDSDTDAVALIIADGQLQGFESSCAIKNFTEIGTGGSAWTATLDCAGEGQTWVGDVLFAMHRDPDGKPQMLVQVDMTDGIVAGYYPCE